MIKHYTPQSSQVTFFYGGSSNRDMEYFKTKFQNHSKLIIITTSMGRIKRNHSRYVKHKN